MSALPLRANERRWAKPHLRTFQRDGFENEARSRGLLWSGAFAPLHQLSHSSVFFRRAGPRRLGRLVEGDPATCDRLALSACAVLPADVLVLRLPHDGGQAGRADRGL